MRDSTRVLSRTQILTYDLRDSTRVLSRALFSVRCECCDGGFCRFYWHLCSHHIGLYQIRASHVTPFINVQYAQIGREHRFRARGRNTDRRYYSD